VNLGEELDVLVAALREAPLEVSEQHQPDFRRTARLDPRRVLPRDPHALFVIAF